MSFLFTLYNANSANKALKGKKVQIEPFRGTPDINNTKDHIRTTTIKEPATPKITIRDKAHLHLKTQCDSIENTGKKIADEFLKGGGFKLDAKPFWTDPIKDGEITLYNFSAVYKPSGSSFGNVRLKSTNGKLVPKAHTGLDIFAEIGTDLFAALDGEVERIYGSITDNSYGNVIVIEVGSVEYLKKSKNKYILKYAKEIKEGPNFDLEGKIYLRYAHVQKSLVKVGDKVISGDKIGLSGVTGNATGTRAPHLHFEIANLPRPGRGLVNRCNPAFYVNLKDETEENKSHQEKISKTAHKV